MAGRDGLANVLLDEYSERNALAGPREPTLVHDPEDAGFTSALRAKAATPSFYDTYIRPWGSNALAARKPWAWTQDYPNLARFLAEGVPLALIWVRASAPRQPMAATAAAAEWPTNAAVRIGDRIFTGDSHFDAVTKAQAALGEDVAHRLLSSGGNTVALDGFLTNKGRYVSREEAGRMLDAHNQSNHYTSHWLTGRQKTGLDSLVSEALESYNLKTGRARWREKP
jgi:hypothetical protein